MAILCAQNQEDNRKLIQPEQIFRITGGNDKQGFPMKQGIVRFANKSQLSKTVSADINL